MTNDNNNVTPEKISDAAARIAPHIHHTPLLRLPAEALGSEIPLTLKLECLQATGSFKARGAMNAMLSAPLPPAGAIAASGGNHGVAAAWAARQLGAKAEIFVPELASEAKIARIAAEGATVRKTGATYDEARQASEARAAETGARIVHAYDQPEVLCGQGTVGLEFEADAPELTHILVATGGGGLIGGIAAWYQSRCQVISVEPEACSTLATALREGRPSPAPVGGIAADSLGARQVGQIMFPIAQRHVAQAITVPEEAIAEARRRLWDGARLLTEPGGATALAALISGRFTPPPGAKVGVLVCGANTDPRLFS
ncbi:threonine/serine dehydratase [Acetobacteraceae bacterium H6797]|nr:threonine/serine dehydratase [Acetobacteraceae bacterium H6797]